MTLAMKWLTSITIGVTTGTDILHSLKQVLGVSIPEELTPSW